MRADHRAAALPSLFDDPEALREPRRTELAAGAVVLHAFALPQNTVSLKIIGKLGFERTGEVKYNGLTNHLFAKTSHHR